jgi:hypothetical protein
MLDRHVLGFLERCDLLFPISRFQIDLGCDEDNLALHFNPRFNDDTDGTVLVCNSKIAGCWGGWEERDPQSTPTGFYIQGVKMEVGKMEGGGFDPD